MPNFDLQNGDSLDVLKEFPDNHFDSIVSDPPYGLSFMGKAWDKSVPSVEIWQECLRVLKPGGHLLAFAGTRTQHRMAVNIEDAGFEIRDMIAWIYGSGFPKSHDVSKAIDKHFGKKREVVGYASTHINRPATENWNKSAQPMKHSKFKEDGAKTGGGLSAITAPATPEAAQWEGWGTALKPALEPITVARKPLTGTVAANVLEWGTGGVNVDGCRVGTEETLGRAKGGWGNSAVGATNYGNFNSIGIAKEGGRWPANLIHDGSDEVVGLFPHTKEGNGKIGGGDGKSKGLFGMGSRNVSRYPGEGSAARFFYCAKAQKKDRNEGVFDESAVLAEIKRRSTLTEEEIENLGPVSEVGGMQNNHNTVKPTDLMRYLCRLVTPPNGLILDPFMGSGSTGKAAVLEGFDFVGIELDPHFVEISRARIEHAEKKKESTEPVKKSSKRGKHSDGSKISQGRLFE